MTTTRTPAGYADHTLIGTPQQIANVIRNHHTAGTFISMGAPRPLSATDPRVRVQVRLRDTTTEVRPIPTPLRPVPSPVRSRHDHNITAAVTRSAARRRTRRLSPFVLAVAAPLVGVVYALGHIAARFTADALTNAAGTIAGVLALAAILTALLRASSGGGRRHCPGCD